MDHEAITEWREEINRTGNTLADDILGQLIVTEDALLAERERAAKLLKALARYADPDHWQEDYSQPGHPLMVYNDGQERAAGWEVAQQVIGGEGRQDG